MTSRWPFRTELNGVRREKWNSGGRTCLDNLCRYPRSYVCILKQQVESRGQHGAVSFHLLPCRYQRLNSGLVASAFTHRAIPPSQRANLLYLIYSENIEETKVWKIWKFPKNCWPIVPLISNEVTPQNVLNFHCFFWSFYHLLNHKLTSTHDWNSSLSRVKDSPCI